MSDYGESSFLPVSNSPCIRIRNRQRSSPEGIVRYRETGRRGDAEGGLQEFEDQNLYRQRHSTLQDIVNRLSVLQSKDDVVKGLTRVNTNRDCQGDHHTPDGVSTPLENCLAPRL
jgi:hypothetical protein